MEKGIIDMLGSVARVNDSAHVQADVVQEWYVGKYGKDTCKAVGGIIHKSEDNATWTEYYVRYMCNDREVLRVNTTDRNLYESVKNTVLKIMGVVQ